MNLEKIWEYGLDFMFPRRCPCCGVLVNWGDTWCSECLETAICIRKIIPTEYDNPIEAVWALSRYEKGMRTLIRDLKFNSKSGTKRAFQPFLQTFATQVGLTDIEAVVPIPSSKENLAERGYNPVSVIFQSWVKAHHLIWCEPLYKLPNTKPMWTLHKEERYENIKGAYLVKAAYSHFNNALRGKTILLVDDVYTTGSTLRIAGQLLVQLGAKKIKALTMASGAL